MSAANDPMSTYLAGERLYGEDLSPAEMENWYAEEAEGYASLGAADRTSYSYSYHELNIRHGFRYLPNRVFNHVLGLGAAWAEELLPIVDRVRQITVLEPSSAFLRNELRGVPVHYVRPGQLGAFPFDDCTFDLATCFGVLHHIPNVSFVAGELARCLKPGGFLLLREPIISMGDWRGARRGLTVRERGIPLPLLREILAAVGLLVVRERLTGFTPLLRVLSRFGIAIYKHKSLTIVDEAVCGMLRYRLRYHATNVFQKIRPSAVYMVVGKPSGRIAA